MNLILILPVVLSFLITFLAMPFWIKKAKKIGLVWENMNQYGCPKNVAGSGGIIVMLAFTLGILFYIALETFILKTNGSTIEIFALLTAIGFLVIVGFVDDLFGWVHGGLSARLRIILAFVAAIPLMVINAGQSKINIPFFGVTEIGLLYPLFAIPIGIAGAATTYNFLAGFNGLEAGQAIIILSFLSFIAYITGSPWLALIGMCMVISLAAFYYYNKFPAKVFPGDAMTYGIGGLIACIAILGDFEKIAIFVFIPYILEVILKLRGKLKKQSFGIPQKDGSLEEPFDKAYGLEHLAIRILKKIKGKAYEKDVTYVIFSFQIIICLLTLVIFREALF